MATYDTQLPTLPAGSTLLNDIVARLRSWSERRATASALAELNDRQLDDLGLLRVDVASIADGTRPAHRI